MIKKLILVCVLTILCTPAFARHRPHVHVQSVPAASQPSALDAWYGSASEPVFVTRGVSTGKFYGNGYMSLTADLMY